MITIGPGAQIQEPVYLGIKPRGNEDRIRIGKNAIIRTGTVIYFGVAIGDEFRCGHNVVIRERTRIGDHTSVGTATVIEGHTEIGNHVNIQSMVYIPLETKIGDNVFIGPRAVFTNDRYPPSGHHEGVTVEDGASIGGNATILPGVVIGKGALVAAGAVVTKDVSEYTLAIGVPAREREIPSEVLRIRECRE